MQIDAVDGEQFTVLLDQRVGWLGENRRQIVYGKFLQHTGDRQTSDELRQQSELGQIIGIDLFEQFLVFHVGVVPIRAEAGLSTA